MTANTYTHVLTDEAEVVYDTPADMSVDPDGSGNDELADEIIELGTNGRQLRVEKVVNLVAQIVLRNS